MQIEPSEAPETIQEFLKNINENLRLNNIKILFKTS